MKKNLIRIGALLSIIVLFTLGSCPKDDPFPTVEVALLSPKNNATDVPLTIQMTWKLKESLPVGVMYEYDVYVDTHNPPADKVGTHITDLSFWPTLSSGTTYYWKVEGIDYNSGQTVVSAKWKFKTVD